VPTNNFMNNSQYFIVMSPFSYSSTANSPIVSSWQTWNNSIGQSFYHPNQNNFYNQQSFWSLFTVWIKQHMKNVLICLYITSCLH